MFVKSPHKSSFSYKNGTSRWKRHQNIQISRQKLLILGKNQYTDFKKKYQNVQISKQRLLIFGQKSVDDGKNERKISRQLSTDFSYFLKQFTDFWKLDFEVDITRRKKERLCDTN